MDIPEQLFVAETSTGIHYVWALSEEFARHMLREVEIHSIRLATYTERIQAEHWRMMRNA
jgi:hypothetical protein